MSYKFTPVKEHLILVVEKEAEETEAGLILLESGRRQHVIAEVFAAHPDDELFKEGDKVIVRRNPGAEIDIDIRQEDLQLRFVNYSMIVCKVEVEEKKDDS